MAVFYKWPLSLEGVWESVLTNENNNIGKMSAFWVWRHHLLTNASLKFNLTTCPHTECSAAFVNSLRQFYNYTGIRLHITTSIQSSHIHTWAEMECITIIIHKIKKYTYLEASVNQCCDLFLVCSHLPLDIQLIIVLLFCKQGTKGASSGKSVTEVTMSNVTHKFQIALMPFHFQ